VRLTPLRILAALVAAFLAIQIVPYGRDHTNPPVKAEPAWTSPQVRALAKTACFDCHSNETAWPWYTNIAPISWRVQRHVDEGRERLDFSTWGSGDQETDSIVETIQRGSMPPFDYLLLHPEARLSDADRATLVAGFRAMFGGGESE
jgi:hypothetical protein